MTVVSIAQPCYLPWLGAFDRMAKSDIHVVLDHVTFEKGSYTNRTRILQPDGRPMWLTIPVEKGKPIRSTAIIGDAWRRKHSEALRQCVGTDLGFLYRPTYRGLLPFLFDSMRPLASWLGVVGPTVRSSELGGDKLGRKSDLVLNICKSVSADVYLSGPLGSRYLDAPSFKRAGVEIVYHDWRDPDDPPLSAVHHIFRSTNVWQQQDLTSVPSSPRSEALA